MRGLDIVVLGTIRIVVGEDLGASKAKQQKKASGLGVADSRPELMVNAVAGSRGGLGDAPVAAHDEEGRTKGARGGTASRLWTRARRKLRTSAMAEVREGSNGGQGRSRRAEAPYSGSPKSSKAVAVAPGDEAEQSRGEA